MRIAIVLAFLLAGCKLAGGGPPAAEEHLGNNAICEWHNSDEKNKEIDCVAAGRKFTCLTRGDRVQCAETTPTRPAEAP